MSNKKLIAVFATEISSRVQGNLYKELHRDAIQLGYNLIFFEADHERVNMSNTSMTASVLFSAAKDICFEAFIIHAQSIGISEIINDLIDMGKQRDIPVFVYDCEAFDIKPEKNVYPIISDYKGGFAKNVRHLIEYHNCKNIFMVAGIKGNSYSEDRIAAYREEMERAGLSITDGQIGYGDFWELPAADATEAFLDGDLPTPDAICCANDTMAISVIRTLQHRGLRVPEDILVTGFDGIEDGKYNYPTISTCEPNLEEVSKYIFDVLTGKNQDNSMLIPLEFYPKESCGCGEKSDIDDRQDVAQLMQTNRRVAWQLHKLSIMQFELLDSCELQDSVMYMGSILDLLPEFSHLYCIRDDVELVTDLTTPLDKMRVHMNMGLLPEGEYGSFSFEDIMPLYDRIISEAAEDEFFIIRMIHCADKVYGYSISKAKEYVADEIKLIDQLSENVANSFESILRNRRLQIANEMLSDMYDRMAEIYIRDTMTGLYNRHGYYQELEKYSSLEEFKDMYVHVISIDMDGMKYINDNFGHMEGDNAIKSVSGAISECFAHPCISARFGGDEFVVTLFTENGLEPSEADISEKLNSYLEISPLLEGKEYKVGVSIGQAVQKLSEISDFKVLEKLADDCMYVNKRSRKGQ